MLREQFPALDRQLYKRPMVYLDNVATSQTPLCVIEAINEGYIHAKANVHRGVHTLSQEATARQEHARERIRQWINARSTSEIIFTRGTTEAINLVAASFGQRFKPGDEIILTVMEHHANIVPWQLLQNKVWLNDPMLYDRLHTLSAEYSVPVELLVNLAVKRLIDDVDLVRSLRKYIFSYGGTKIWGHKILCKIDKDFYNI